MKYLELIKARFNPLNIVQARLDLAAAKALKSQNKHGEFDAIW